MTFPLLKTVITRDKQRVLFRRLCAEDANIEDDAAGGIIFSLQNDDTSWITRAVQEQSILATRVGGRPCFVEVWAQSRDLRDDIRRARDPHEAKWTLAKKYRYKLATTFMPAFAKAIYAYFNAHTVLDPCAGWGDRLLGAAAANCVESYVGFDPNRALQAGYGELMREVAETRKPWTVYGEPFEQGATMLADESVDLVFTSPPFFDYECYVSTNPQYADWIVEFYTPLFVQSARVVKVGGHVAIHIEDTSAGQIEHFLTHTVQTICPLRLDKKIGLMGVWSHQIRPVWVFIKEGLLTSCI